MQAGRHLHRAAHFLLLWPLPATRPTSSLQSVLFTLSLHQPTNSPLDSSSSSAKPVLQQSPIPLFLVFIRDVCNWKYHSHPHFAILQSQNHHHFHGRPLQLSHLIIPAAQLHSSFNHSSQVIITLEAQRIFALYTQSWQPLDRATLSTPAPPWSFSHLTNATSPVCRAHHELAAVPCSPPQSPSSAGVNRPRRCIQFSPQAP